MKRMMLVGGMTGFGLGTLGGVLTEGATWPGTLLRASIAALAGGLLLRWWTGLLARCLKQAQAERAGALAQTQAPLPLAPQKR